VLLGRSGSRVQQVKVETLLLSLPELPGLHGLQVPGEIKILSIFSLSPLRPVQMIFFVFQILTSKGRSEGRISVPAGFGKPPWEFGLSCG